jgi:predicted ATPase
MVGLVTALRASDGLLVIDAAEHRVAEIAELATSLLSGCPELRVLVTSRQPLRLRDEATVPLGALSRSDRRALLVDRARLNVPSYTLPSAEYDAADRLCELVDGLPLGIELVARHLRLLPIAELAARVDADLERWTAGAGETAGLITAVAAGVEELADGERSLLACLAVLPAEADLELIQQVATPDAADDVVFAALAQLVDRSLVQVRGGPAGVRYGVLLSVRRFCLSLLDESTRRGIEHRYVAAVLRRFERLAASLKSPDRSAVLAELDADAPHLQTALAASLEGDAATALRVATGLADYWLARRPSEGMAWLQRLLAAAPPAGAARAEVLLQMGHLAYWLTEFDLGTALLTEARDLLAGTDNVVLLGRVLRRMGAIAAASDEVARARDLLEQSAAVLASGDNEVEEAMSLLHLGVLLADESRTDEALPVLVKARDALRAAGDPLQEGHALSALNVVWWKSGDLVAALGAGERALEQFRALGHRPSEGVVAYRLASITRSLGDVGASRHYVAIARDAGRQSGTRTTTALAEIASARLNLDAGDVGRAAREIAESLEALDIVTDRWVLVEALEVAARLQALRGRPARSLFDRAEELRAVIGQPAPPSYASEIAELRARLDDATGVAAGGPEVNDPAALRAWALDVTSAAGPGNARSTARRT